MTRRCSRLLLLLSVTLAPRALAYRPFDQTDADVAELHVIELELGPAQLQWSNGRTEYVPTFIFNLGFATGTELVVDMAGSGTLAGPRVPGEVPQFEVGIAVKALLRRGSLQDAEGPSIAIEPELLLPATAGPSGFGFAAGLIVSQRWTGLTVHLNLVPAWSRAHRLAGEVGVIVEGPADWTVRPVAEAYLEAEHGASSVTVSGLGGCIWRISPVLSGDAALRIGTVEGIGLVEVRVGLTWDIPL